MPYHITCSCGRLFVAPESKRGQSLCCPRCGQNLQVQQDAIAAPPPTPPPPADMPAGEMLPAAMLPIETAAVPVASAGIRSRQGVSLMAAALTFIVLFSLLPLYLELWETFANEIPMRMERWAFVLIGLGALQIAYSVYLIQLPDWSSIWVVSAMTLLIATGYATLMGVRLLANRENPLIQLLELDGNRFSTTQEAGWCLIMLLLMALFSYFAGRFGSRWHRRWSQCRTGL